MTPKRSSSKAGNAIRKDTIDDPQERIMMLQSELEEKDSTIERLNESIEQYRTLIDLSPDPVVILQDGTYQLVSSSFTEVFGYNQEDIRKGLSFMKLVSEEDADDVMRRYQERLDGIDLPKTYRIDLVTKSGDIIPCETSANRIIYGGEPADLVFIRDISERVDIENEIRNMEEMYEMLVSTSLDAITVTDINGNLTFISDQTLKLHGYDSDEFLIGKSAFLLIAPEDHDRAMKNLEKTMNDGIVQSLEYSMIRADGSTFIGELNATLIRDHEDEPKGFIATVRDITDRKRAADEIKKSEEKYRTLAEGIHEGVYTLDADGRFTFINDVILERSGRTREWFIGRHFLANIREEDHSQAQENFNATMRGEKADMAEVAVHMTDSGVRWVEINTTAIKQGDSIVGLLGVSRDISLRRTQEQIQKVMVDITNATNMSQGLEELFHSIQHNLGKVMDTTNFYIALYDEDTDMITLPYFIDEADAFTAIPARKTFTSFVIRNDRPILITESDIDELVRTGEVEVVGTKPKVWVGVPLKRGDSVIGAVVVQSYTDPTTYSEEDFEVLKFVSDHIALAINRKSVDDALKESEEKYRTLFNWSTDAIFIHTVDLQIFDVNERAIKLMGYSRKEMLSLLVTDLHPKEALEHSREAFTQIETDGYVHLKIDFKRKNGEIFTADLSSSIFEIGGRQFVQGIVRDITEQERAHKSLQESEEKFRTFAEQSPNMIFINQRNRIRYVNQRCVDIMGYAREEFYSPDFDFWVLIDPESIPVIREKLSQHTNMEEITPYEYRLIAKDGSIIDAINNSRMIDFDGGKALLGIVTNITEIKRTERMLELSEDRYREIFDSTREGIIVTDQNGVIISANPGAAAMLGYRSPNLLVGTPEIDLFVEHDKQEVLTQDLQEKGNIENLELQLIRKDERLIHVLCTASIRHLGGGNDEQQLIFMDITERKQAEEEMKRRLMKFRLEEGNFYLVQESTPTLSIEAFKDLQQVGYSGVVFSRSLREELAVEIGEDFEYHWLAEKDAIFSLKPVPKEIIKRFEPLTRRHVVFIDRLDYLIFKLGFKKALSLIQYLRELIYLKGTIVILSIDPQTLKREELRLLEKECREVEPLHKNILSDDLFNILKFIYRQNTLGIKPSYSSVGKELSISKPTVRKRVGDLISTGYVREDIKGRNKAIELTERGRQLFWK